MFSQAQAVEAAHTLWAEKQRDASRLGRIDSWSRWDHEPIDVPVGASKEHKRLAELSRTPWLSLVVTNIAQTLFADGFRSPDERENAGPWRIWQANQFDSRQTAVHRAALNYGLAYVTILPGRLRTGEAMARLRGVSPRRMVALYADPGEDEWPIMAGRFEKASTSKWLVRVYDQTHEYLVEMSSDGAQPEFIESRYHGAGVCPVVRYSNMLDLEGRCDGEVEPLISLAARINKTDYDRLLSQHFGSWKVRTISGIDLTSGPDGVDGAEVAALRLRQNDMLTAVDPDTKFGTLDETPLDGFISAHSSDVETLAAVAQVPATALSGKVSNISADALAELRAGLTLKSYERQRSFGESHAQALRLGSALNGDPTAAEDYMSQVTWQDMQIRSMSQAVDALGKAAQMLMIPVEGLWPMIPGVTKSDVDEWKQMASSGDAFAQLSRLLDGQADG